MPVKRSSEPIVLTISGIGHCLSFKNRKHAGRTPSGGMTVYTEKRIKAWMNQAKSVIASQLRSAAATELGATLTESQLRFWIVSRIPLNDCRQVICKLIVEDQQVEPGQEGAEIIIERC